jgi:hypothetical protein
MNIHVGIIDQQVRGFAARRASRLEEELGRSLDETSLRSIAFVALCAKVMLGLNDDEAIECLTEGGNDFGVDAIMVGDLVDGEFVVTLLQGKYHHTNLDGVRGFPQSGVEKAVQAVRALFNPRAPLSLNHRLMPRIEEIRSLIVDGNIPRVRFLLCSNGAPWKAPEAQSIIDRESFGDRATFEHVNHDRLVQILAATQPVTETIRFVGRSLVEDIQFVRVFIGKVSVGEVARIMAAHGDRLLDRNIRRYLGLHGNRVNEAIQRTLLDEHERPNFFFYNNGITLICDRFDFNGLQPDNHLVRVEGLQIINGGQTSKTIEATYSPQQPPLVALSGDDAHVLVRLYQVPRDAGPSVQTITYAINSQNPVDLKDLRSSDERQKRLEMDIRPLGFEYRRQRTDVPMLSTDITVSTAAEAVLSVWREQPHLARFRQNHLFDRSYSAIFTDDLTGAQVIIAVLLFRLAENRRKRPPVGAPELVRYGSHFIAMLMGRTLLHEAGLKLRDLDHRTISDLRNRIDSAGERIFEEAVTELQSALGQLYGEQPVSAQRLAATFRRGDLLEVLRPR